MEGKSKMKHYKVFKRAWWRKDASGRLVPYPGARKTTLRTGLSYDEARDSYWFSEHPPTAFLIRELSKVYLEGQGHTIDHIRQLWREEMEKHEQSRPQS